MSDQAGKKLKESLDHHKKNGWFVNENEFDTDYNARLGEARDNIMLKVQIRYIFNNIRKQSTNQNSQYDMQ